MEKWTWAVATFRQLIQNVNRVLKHTGASSRVAQLRGLISSDGQAVYHFRLNTCSGGLVTGSAASLTESEKKKVHLLRNIFKFPFPGQSSNRSVSATTKRTGSRNNFQ